ncbi:DUF1622 domain-containing protein [Myxosarcina sp. GI1]|uniref:DUF1622 domain-containing protein n=1 Tax=Myxosarcina sp. GI1 TaxID=1541065 RepID=UPI00069094EF|nr:DUF1622 domain-containing protein [Myxosarcina sp. GI1]
MEHYAPAISNIEFLLTQAALIVKIIIEAVAVILVAFSIIKTIPKIVRSYRHRQGEDFYREIRLDLGLSLVLALELLLAADIVGTSVSPSWNSIGILVAIAAIRTILNYFLEKEIKQLEAERLKGRKDLI